MAAITIKELDADGQLDDIALVSAAGSQTIEGGTGAGGWQLPVYFVVRNGDSGSHDVTIAGQPLVTVAAGKTAIFRVKGGYSQAARAITYSATTSMTVGAFRDRP